MSHSPSLILHFLPGPSCSLKIFSCSKSTRGSVLVNVSLTSAGTRQGSAGADEWIGWCSRGINLPSSFMSRTGLTGSVGTRTGWNKHRYDHRKESRDLPWFDFNHLCNNGNEERYGPIP